MREAFYKYHRLGLDMLSTDEEAARAVINSTIYTLKQVNNDNPSTMLMQFFFNAKGEELINFLAKTSMQDKQKLIPILSSLDVSNASKYNKSFDKLTFVTICFLLVFGGNSCSKPKTASYQKNE